MGHFNCSVYNPFTTSAPSSYYYSSPPMRTSMEDVLRKIIEHRNEQRRLRAAELTKYDDWPRYSVGISGDLKHYQLDHDDPIHDTGDLVTSLKSMFSKYEPPATFPYGYHYPHYRMSYTLGKLMDATENHRREAANDATVAFINGMDYEPYEPKDQLQTLINHMMEKANERHRQHYIPSYYSPYHTPYTTVKLQNLLSQIGNHASVQVIPAEPPTGHSSQTHQTYNHSYHQPGSKYNVAVSHKVNVSNRDEPEFAPPPDTENLQNFINQLKVMYHDYNQPYVYHGVPLSYDVQPVVMNLARYIAGIEARQPAALMNENFAALVMKLIQLLQTNYHAFNVAPPAPSSSHIVVHHPPSILPPPSHLLVHHPAPIPPPPSHMLVHHPAPIPPPPSHMLVHHPAPIPPPPSHMVVHHPAPLAPPPSHMIVNHPAPIAPPPSHMIVNHPAPIAPPPSHMIVNHPAPIAPPPSHMIVNHPAPIPAPPSHMIVNHPAPIAPPPSHMIVNHPAPVKPAPSHLIVNHPAPVAPPPSHLVVNHPAPLVPPPTHVVVHHPKPPAPPPTHLLIKHPRPPAPPPTHLLVNHPIPHAAPPSHLLVNHPTPIAPAPSHVVVNHPTPIAPAPSHVVVNHPTPIAPAPSHVVVNHPVLPAPPPSHVVVNHPTPIAPAPSHVVVNHPTPIAPAPSHVVVNHPTPIAPAPSHVVVNHPTPIAPAPSHVVVNHPTPIAPAPSHVVVNHPTPIAPAPSHVVVNHPAPIVPAPSHVVVHHPAPPPPVASHVVVHHPVATPALAAQVVVPAPAGIVKIQHTAKFGQLWHNIRGVITQLNHTLHIGTIPAPPKLVKSNLVSLVRLLRKNLGFHSTILTHDNTFTPLKSPLGFLIKDLKSLFGQHSLMKFYPPSRPSTVYLTLYHVLTRVKGYIMTHPVPPQPSQTVEWHRFVKYVETLNTSLASYEKEITIHESVVEQVPPSFNVFATNLVGVLYHYQPIQVIEVEPEPQRNVDLVAIYTDLSSLFMGSTIDEPKVEMQPEFYDLMGELKNIFAQYELEEEEGGPYKEGPEAHQELKKLVDSIMVTPGVVPASASSHKQSHEVNVDVHKTPTFHKVKANSKSSTAHHFTHINAPKVPADFTVLGKILDSKAKEQAELEKRQNEKN